MTRAALMFLAAGLAAVVGGCRTQTRAGGEAPPPEAVKPAGDLPTFPMPANLPGMDLLVGEVELGEPDETGSPVTVVAAKDTVTLTVAVMQINCCTQRTRPSLEVRDGVAEVRLWEYLTDVCECFTRRSVRMRLAPLDLAGKRVVVYSNAGTIPVAESAPAR